MYNLAFMPHGKCYFWRSELLTLHGVSDLLIALSYYSIPLTIAYFIWNRRDLPFRFIFLLFLAFIITCGTTHLFEVIILWYPIYWITGLLKASTALISLFTAVACISIIPQALQLPSPDQLWHANQKLADEIQEREQIQQQLRRHKNFLNRIYTGIEAAIFVLEPDDDHQFRYVGANPFFASLIDVANYQIEGKTPLELIPHMPSDKATKLVTDLDFCLKNYHAIQYEEIYELGKNKTWWLTTLSPEIQPGETPRIIGTSVNITAQKHLESELRVQINKAVNSARLNEVLLKEIHHRTKNNLQLISGLVYLQMQHIQEPGTHEVLLDIRNRIQSIALLHEKLYSSKDLGRIPFSHYIDSLAHGVLLTYTSDPERIKLEIEADDFCMDIDKAVPCGLVITELMINALKHAFPEERSGLISIGFSVVEDHVELRIEDDGVGSKITSPEQGGFGLRLVNSLVTRQLKGSLTLGSAGGTQYVIRFQAR